MAGVHLTIRSLHGDSTKVEVLASESVKALKENIARWQNSTRDNVIVMLAGRSLDDEQSLEAEGVRDGAKLVVAVKGKRLQKSVSMECPAVKESPLLAHSKSMLQPPAISPSPVPSGLRPAPAVPRPVVPQAEGPRPPGIRPPSGSQGPSGLRPQGSAPRSSPVSDRDVAALVEMGYTDTEASAALQRANGNLELAASILSGDAPQENGIERVQEEIRRDPSKLDFYLNALLQSPEAKKMEEERPGQLRRLLSGDLGAIPQRGNPRAVANLVEIGFTEDQAKKALAEANGNEEVALNILLGS